MIPGGLLRYDIEQVNEERWDNSKPKDNGEAMEGIIEASGSRDQGTKGESDRKKVNEKCVVVKGLGGHGVIIEELIGTE